jgi:phenylacetate-CoA ligase
MDEMIVKIETNLCDPEAFQDAIVAALKLKGQVELVAPGELPRDGIVIEDIRKYD